MAEQRERQGDKVEDQNRAWAEQTRAAGNREGIPAEEAENTPPGGDARTIYSNDRAPGQPEPDRP